MSRFGESRVRLNQINKPITLLLGPNGAGKSMSLLELKSKLEDLNIPVFYFSSSKNDCVSNNMYFDPGKLSAAFSSEGERIMTSLFYWTKEDYLPRVLKEDLKSYFILIDELDSGLSLDRLLLLMKDFFSIIKMELEKGRDVNVVLTANSYELLSALQDEFKESLSIIWVPSHKEIVINSYNDYRKLYLPRFRYYIKQREEN